MRNLKPREIGKTTTTTVSANFLSVSFVFSAHAHLAVCYICKKLLKKEEIVLQFKVYWCPCELGLVRTK